ncbi:Glyoxalase-like domain protein [Falsiruegeria litorea R37]|uniref:Glyoxalase-like domain protein n=1 Tax=Falsiruegeria litorea R37 TaxID=1200284 RepID=A0A1Y5TQG9_9RHOB|nr:VOC family protein [Falsiruegeria litorea]SLN65789.1 Glyoxalase-like domain protein [Falsiruegeria litorea R37]
MTATLEHTNFTVADPHATAAWMHKVFGWHTRWEGEAISGGYTVHVGNAETYLALYRPPATQTPQKLDQETYDFIGGLNHVAVVVEDFEATEALVKEAGFTPGEHHDYEPGRRFYFHDDNNIEFEVVHYD